MNAPVGDPDPFQALGEALRAVIEEAVSKALDSVKASTKDHAVMLSIPEAAHRLGIGTTKVKQLVASGELASLTIGRRRLILATSVESIASNEKRVGVLGPWKTDSTKCIENVGGLG